MRIPARERPAPVDKQRVRQFFPRLVEIAGPPDQPAFLATVSATGLQFAPRLGGRKQRHLKGTLRSLRVLHAGAAGDQGPEKDG